MYNVPETPPVKAKAASRFCNCHAVFDTKCKNLHSLSVAQPQASTLFVL